MNSQLILRFVTESNGIEGITREPTKAELETMVDFLDLPVVQVRDLENFVSIYQPGAKLRTEIGMNVRVGSHVAPRGSPQIRHELEELLERADGDEHPYITHVAYQTLHPFMDGNGRSGRALWAWQMLDRGTWPQLDLGFLHAFYYQALEHSRRDE